MKPDKQHFASNLMSRIASNEVLDAAMTHVDKRRLSKDANSDIWDLSLHWSTRRETIREHLLTGRYQLSPLQVLGSKNGHALTRWSSMDAVVLKAMTIVLTPLLGTKMDRRCHHLTGNGGLKGAVNRVRGYLTKQVSDGAGVVSCDQNLYQFVIKSDIADFYASTSHDVLHQICSKHIKDRRVLDVLQQYMNRVELRFGEHDLIELGIAKGCPLSPLMGALMLKSLDKMIPRNCAYARYMDDWVILIPTRRVLKRLVKKMHQIVSGLRYKLAKNKTYIGRISKGFDFLGYRFGEQGLVGLAAQTIENHKIKLSRLYEQNASEDEV